MYASADLQECKIYGRELQLSLKILQVLKGLLNNAENHGSKEERGKRRRSSAKFELVESRERETESG